MRGLRVLVAEDNPDDAELLVRELRRHGFDPQWKRVDTEPAFLEGLAEEPDIVLSDYSMPQFSGLRAAELLRDSGLNIPFILISGTVGEETAVEAMKLGATDYLLKDRTARLGSAVEHALDEKALREERRRGQQALRESEERFRLLTENIQDVFWITDGPKEQMIYISPAYEKIWGRSCKELYERPGSWMEAIHPEDRERMREALQKQVQGTFDEEYRIVRPDGSVRWIRDRAFPVADAEGAMVRTVGVARDVTERKDAEHALRESKGRLREQAVMLDHSHEAIIVRDIDTKEIAFWNRGAERLYGWTEAEALGVDSRKLLMADPAAPDVITARLLETGEWRGELKQVTKIGKTLMVSTHATLVRDTEGRPKSALIINIDITAQKELEAQFLRAQRLESIGTLASGVAHDLNNILSPILMAAPLLRGKLPEDFRDKVVDTIEKSAERGAEIVKQVLTFARGAEGMRVPVQVGQLVDEMSGIIRQTFPKNITIRTRRADRIPTVEGDPTQLDQVLLNLCVNARDAMPNGGELTLGLENFTVDENYAGMMPGSAPGQYVVILASDTGSGIPREIMDKIFDPFFTTKEAGNGTGLGLSTVIGIVKSHGGFLTVESEPDRGTTFKIFLPAMGSEGAATAGGAEPPAEGRGELILVVDDEESILKVTQAMLEKHGYRVVTATDGVDALAIFAGRTEEIKAVVTDVVMPLMDGTAMANVLLRMSPKTPVIACSGQWGETREQKLREAGVRIFLKKPYITEKLLTALRSVLDG